MSYPSRKETEELLLASKMLLADIRKSLRWNQELREAYRREREQPPTGKVNVNKPEGGR